MLRARGGPRSSVEGAREVLDEVVDFSSSSSWSCSLTEDVVVFEVVVVSVGGG